MSGRHRKPTRSGLRLAKAGTLTLMVVAPMGATGSAFALPWSPTDLDDDSSASDDDSSEWTNRHADDDGDERDADWADQDTSRWHDQSASASSRTSADKARRSAAEAKRAAAEVKKDSSRTDATPASSTRRVQATPASGNRRTQATPSRRAAERAATRSAAEPTAQSAAAEAKWDRLAQCESTQNWDANTGNGYKGGLQFSDSTWRAYGGHNYARSADQASRAEQIAVARKVQQEQGWGAWPSCSRKLGYRS